MYPSWKNFEVYTYCKKCGSEVVVDASIVLTSLPPQYHYECPNCGNVGSVRCSETKTRIVNDEKNI